MQSLSSFTMTVAANTARYSCNMSLTLILTIFVIKIIFYTLQSISPCYQQLFTLCQTYVLFSSFGLSIYILLYIKLYLDFSYLWWYFKQFTSNPLSPHLWVANYCFKIIPPSWHFCTFEQYIYFLLFVSTWRHLSLSSCLLKPLSLEIPNQILTVPIISSKLQHGIASMCNSIHHIHDHLTTTPSLHITD